MNKLPIRKAKATKTVFFLCFKTQCNEGRYIFLTTLSRKTSPSFPLVRRIELNTGATRREIRIDPKRARHIVVARGVNILPFRHGGGRGGKNTIMIIPT